MNFSTIEFETQNNENNFNNNFAFCCIEHESPRQYVDSNEKTKKENI